MRAVAVLLVVAYHYAPKAIRGGFVGVDVFFVISGFLISRIIIGDLDRGTFSFVDFYARRVRRILPALALVLLSTLAFGTIWFFPHELKEAGKHAAAGALFISNFALWKESGYFDASAETKPFLHLWSLAIEEQFYICWPLVLWCGVRNRRALALVTSFAIASFAIDMIYMRTNSTADFYSPASRAWELMAGAWQGTSGLRQSGRIPPRALRHPDLQATVGVALLLIAVVTVDTARPYPGAWALLPVLGTVLLISAGKAAWINQQVLSSRPLVWLGSISYPLYLWHWCLLVCARLAGDGTPSKSLRASLLMLSIVLAVATFKFVEQPIQHGHPRRRCTALSLLATAIAAVAGAWCFFACGFPERLPIAIRQIATTPEATAHWREGTCFLRSDQHEEAFANCPLESPDGRPTLLLWGDSEAAQLEPGYERYFARYRIVQRTASGCRPIVDLQFVNQPHCHDINDAILRSLEQIQPTRVVLAGRWAAIDWTLLQGTIHALHSRGITQIDLIGPAPEWDAPLPRLLYHRFEQFPGRTLPIRSNESLASEITMLDASMTIFAQAQGVHYESVLSTLCDALGCLTIVNGQPTAWDAFHLTQPSAMLVVSRFAGAVDGPKPAASEPDH